MEVSELPSAESVSHMITAHIHANPCFFISLHDSKAISCLVVVFTCQVL